MNEEDIGKVFLFACPWGWTFVGRLVGFVGNRLIIEDGGYFTRLGATFNVLCARGFVAETIFHPARFTDQNGKIVNPKGIMKIPNEGPAWSWYAPWPQGENS